MCCLALSLKGCGVGESEVRGWGGGGVGVGVRAREVHAGPWEEKVGISEGPEAAAGFGAPLKRQCSGRLLLLDCSEKSGLEALPQDVLIRILCQVEHGDLKRLVRLCKTIKEATVVAKQWHFADTKPTKIRAFRNSTDSQNPSD